MSGRIAPVTDAAEAPAKLTKLRTQDFSLPVHSHGKAKVRVMKVVRTEAKHFCYEYSVDTTLYSPTYERVFTADDNTDLVATDTQKNTVYVVAKRTKADSPEQFAVDLCKHFLSEYSILTGAEALVRQVVWERAVVDGSDHDHGWIKRGPEMNVGHCKFDRDDVPVVTSKLQGYTIFKSTQSGFANYLQDKYTLLPPCEERCLSTEMDATWTYAGDIDGDCGGSFDYSSLRTTVVSELTKGIFGPASGGVFSVSLQATIYDAGCMVLTACPDVKNIKIETPNKHYLPYRQLETLGETFEDDVFTPTDEPSGTIQCIVER
ncbi:hypothetical protein TrVE_jg7449 [Triparma verrucosa]|uniref:Uricase n=1 Tax=Triparma verrucosa TaxID=1606542 RepID=A0A9W7FL60_9STRA|nr:hypothetical protein TrVE_jg7449 [Triparma verrucosa]|mmetsp:Transcript_410/g.712  ORF Transcript_410/g.712 Transcript_410/m.712 type:complete len:319 (+) Transcript_410:316-1272(+)